MKRYLITFSIQGDKRIIIRTEKQLYKGLHWKDGKLRWGNPLLNDIPMSEETFRYNINNLLVLTKSFEEVINISTF